MTTHPLTDKPATAWGPNTLRLGLAALALAPLGLAAAPAQASVIVTPANANIGTAAGDLPGYTLVLPTSSAASVYAFNSMPFEGIQFGNGSGVIADNSYHGLGTPEELGAGVSVQSAISSAPQTDQFSDIDVSAPGGFPYQGTFAPSYIAFDFTALGGQTDYGYLYGSETLADNNSGDVTYNLISYGYDDTGADLPTGAPASTPEPSTVAPFAFLGLGMLGLTLRARKRRSSIPA